MFKKIVSATTPFLLFACSDFSTDLKDESVLNYGNSADKILTCNKELEGKVVKPADGSEYRLCKEGQWFAVDIDDFDESDLYTPDGSVSKSSSSKSVQVIFDEDDELDDDKSSSSSKQGTSSSSRKAVFDEDDGENIVVSKRSSSSTVEAVVSSSSSKTIDAASSSSVTISLSSSSVTAARSSSSATIAKSSSSTAIASSSSVAAVKSSSSIAVASSSSATPVEDLFICEDGKTIVVDEDNCPENQKSSSSVVATSSSSAKIESSSSEKVTSSSSYVSTGLVPSGTYDCETYNCVSTQYLNQTMLKAGDYMEYLDIRDSQVYKTVKIDSQIWMAQNLNYNYNVESAKSFCYSNSLTNCAKYGRLYLWSAAMDSAAVFSDAGKSCGYGKLCSPSGKIRGICPEGWHLPTSTEWKTLWGNVGGINLAAKVTKTTTDWTNSGNGTNAYGFSVLPSGEYDISDFDYVGTYVSFWSATETSSTHASYRDANNRDDNFTEYNNYKTKGGAIRCLYDGIVETLSSSSAISSSSAALIEESSSSEEAESSSSESSTQTALYDCDTYNCVTTEFLNQEMLEAGKYGELLDTRDNQVYRTIKIGEQVWMAQNLNYVTEGGNADNGVGTLCYDNVQDNCNSYGRFYTWAAMMDLASTYNKSIAKNKITVKHQGVCPSNWHVPTYEEWKTLFEYVGGTSNAGAKLKSQDSWARQNGTDEYGFSVHGYSTISPQKLGKYIDYWTASEVDETRAQNWAFYYDGPYVIDHNYSKENDDELLGVQAVRCIQD